MPHHQSTPQIEEGERALTRSPSVDKPRGLEDVDSWGSLLGGGALMIYGLRRKTLSGLFLAGIGAGLIYRGAKNNRMLDGGLKSLVLNTKATEPVEIEKSVTIDKPIGEVYEFWRNLENLPLFMRHIESIDQIDAHRSHWVVHLPSGIHLEWEARILEERKNEFLAWRSIEGSDIFNEGFVTFSRAPNGAGTEVHARIIYRPPAGEVGHKIAEFLNFVPAKVVKEDLRRFKAILEAGEYPTIEGQASGRAGSNGSRPSQLH
ncbi:MAG: SRPBCC family protein [Bradymonadaceae bacterium]